MGVATILVSYDGRSGTARGRAMHKHYLIEQLRARLRLDQRGDSTRRPHPLLPAHDGGHAGDAAPRAQRSPPVVVEINAPPEETLADGSSPAQRGRVAIRAVGCGKKAPSHRSSHTPIITPR
ncbi:MAG: hypothetical protein ACHQ4J_07335 [Candidatus Binatia bacterium]